MSAHGGEAQEGQNPSVRMKGSPGSHPALPQNPRAGWCSGQVCGVQGSSWCNAEELQPGPP